ncbi:MAG: outer membrane beta-barrel protein [Bryobacterales bacterium]|nr:outer membrane beta-barrel protein [Bryobacterales bacterium]
MKYSLFLLLFVPAFAHAQGFEVAVSGGVSRISDGDLGSGYSLDSGTRIAFRGTLNPYNHLGFEFGYAYNRTHLGQEGFTEKQGMAIHQGMFGAVAYATPTDARIRPFVAGGVHFANFVPPGQTAQYGQGENKFGVNYGAGIKVKVSGPWHVRFDVRQFNTGRPFSLGRGGRLMQTEITGGVGYGW